MLSKEEFDQAFQSEGYPQDVIDHLWMEKAVWLRERRFSITSLKMGAGMVKKRLMVLWPNSDWK